MLTEPGMCPSLYSRSLKGSITSSFSPFCMRVLSSWAERLTNSADHAALAMIMQKSVTAKVINGLDLSIFSSSMKSISGWRQGRKASPWRDKRDHQSIRVERSLRTSEGGMGTALQNASSTPALSPMP
ncbi:hypothetical protein DESC_970056 [Desulfosarcina cetonica]|nr:hypothetical protein DESC_970056 [Desulfosarcina cetonica]